MSGYERVLKVYTSPIQDGETVVVTVDCPAGKKVVGGGALNNGGVVGPELSLVFSGPRDENTWEIRITNPDSSGDSFTEVHVYAICVATN